MQINSKKCVFRVTLRKFLSYLVSLRGIKANLDKILTLINMRYPSCNKEVQQLNGRITALICFISKGMEKCFPFFQMLNKNKEYVGNTDYE